MADEPPSSQLDEDAKCAQDSGSAAEENGTSAREAVSISEMEACLDNGNAFNRELVARVILETLRSIPVPDTRHDLSRVLAIISRLGDDPEPSVRAELMEQVPHVAMYCHEEKDDHQWTHLIPSFLLPLVVRYLTDVNNQVRKTAQAALLVLLEQELVAHSDVRDQVCPLLLMLTGPEAHDDFRTEAIALVCRMAPLLGGELSRRMFLDRFAELCSDGLFHVRKICASNFGEFCSVVGQHITETVLLEKFFILCEDDLWGVRKACAEVFMSLSRVVSVGKRRHDLGARFVNLLQDESRWVRMAAFQALGPFISTFSSSDGLDEVSKLDNDMGSTDTCIDNQTDSSISIEKNIEAEEYNSFHYWRDPLPVLDFEEELKTAQATHDSSIPTQGNVIEENKTESVSDSVEKALEDLMARVELGQMSGDAAGQNCVESGPSMESEPEPIHAFDLRRVACQELLGGSSDPETNDLSNNESLTSTVEIQSSIYHPNLPLPPAYVKSDLPTVYSNTFYSLYSDRRLSVDGMDIRSQPYNSIQPHRNRGFQNIVPQKLMDYYLEMTDPYYVETVDSEITRHCAYSLPAVVCTLGKEHWSLLRDLYESLASDMQWKVRRTLASSIHEIGAILGEEIVIRDLIPVFDGFIKDLDEVRVGVLKHLSDFLKLLPEKDRRGYLPRLADFLKLDNEQNWRFRQELAFQLQAVVALYSPADTAQSILPLALTLAADRVAAVRNPAFTLVSQIVKQVTENSWEGSSMTLSSLLADLRTKFCHGNRWMLRQSYVNICNRLVADQSLPLEEFARELLVPLLALKHDRVPNVRLVLARVINSYFKYNDFFASADSPYREMLNETLLQLSNDEDRDVSYYASVSQDTGLSQTSLLPSMNECVP